ncbi:hypothetical protein E2C01_093858 [Portunus trituberculatus]|uniref:Uncharacterized protein n=1 Tax=Portunus trituberculatus TaxID=210409 RepID=A0A5B7JVC5_PORTR|nr:hypothetical protein [Portunus trituberculatus]
MWCRSVPSRCWRSSVSAGSSFVVM